MPTQWNQAKQIGPAMDILLMMCRADLTHLKKWLDIVLHQHLSVEEAAGLHPSCPL